MLYQWGMNGTELHSVLRIFVIDNLIPERKLVNRDLVLDSNAGLSLKILND